MYGFLPPGTFRLVNKFSSSFQLFGGVLRSIKADASEGNLTLFKQLMSHINKHPDLTVFYTSSISVYGRSETIIDEDTRLDPKTSSARAITKIEKQFER